MIGQLVLLIAFTAFGLWACAGTDYRRRHPDTYENAPGLLAWGARTKRYRGRAPEEVARLSAYELWFWLAFTTVGEVAIIYSLAA